MVDGTDVLNPATSPMSKNAIGIFAFDVGSDGASNVSAPIPTLFGLPFITGVDHFIPAADPTDRTVSIVNVPRGDTTRLQVMNVPNWASSGHAVSVQFDDHLQNAEDAVGYVARYSNFQCEVVAKFAAGFHFDSSDDLIRLGVNGFRDVADAGTATPVPNPPANDRPCDVLVVWPSVEAPAIDDAAEAWGVTGDQLHNIGGWLVVVLVYLALVGGG